MSTQKATTELRGPDGDWIEEVDGAFTLVDGVDDHGRTAVQVASDVLATHRTEWDAREARVVSRDDDTWGDVLVTVDSDDTNT